MTFRPAPTRAADPQPAAVADGPNPATSTTAPRVGHAAQTRTERQQQRDSFLLSEHDRVAAANHGAP